MSEPLLTMESIETSSLPGSKLKSAREDKKLSIETIASGLMLEPAVIQALENDDYDSLPEMAYIRGYLLSYTRMLGLPESVLASFDDLNRAKYPLSVNGTGSRPSCSDDGWVRCISVGLLALLVLVVGLWVYENTISSDGFVGKEAPATVVETDNADVMPETVLDSAPDQVLDPIRAPDIENVPLAEEQPVEAAEPAVVTPVVSSESQNTADLLISFTGESWVQVNDSDGKRLRSGIYNSEDKIAMSSERSYSIIIGRVDNVEISFMGEMVKLEPYRQGRAVHITLSPPTE